MDFQRTLDSMIASWQQQNVVPHLLLHVCCAPCSSYCLEYLSQYCCITVYYYNPNITDEAEYRHRADEVKRLISELAPVHAINYMEGAFDPRLFLTAVHGLEHEPEGGARCEVCFRLRLTDAERVAREIGADYFTTSLTISPLKNATLINAIGTEIASSPLASSPLASPAPQWLPSDFKKRGGYLRSIQLSREHQLYRQNYCGCVFSRKSQS